MTGSAGVLAFVLAETAAGGAAFLFLTPLWDEVKRGFFVLTGSVTLVLSLCAAGAIAAGTAPGDGDLALGLCLGLSGATLVWLVLMLWGRRMAARVLGVATVPLAGAMLATLAGTADEGFALSLFQLLAGAAFTGAVLDGLLLGHWYLTDRKLPRGPINRMAWALIGAVALETIALALGRFGSEAGPGPGTSGSLNPLLGISGSAAFIALGMALCTGLIAVFIKLTLRGSRPSAVQSATGFFYLAVMTAFTAELMAKLRFLP